MSDVPKPPSRGAPRPLLPTWFTERDRARRRIRMVPSGARLLGRARARQLVSWRHVRTRAALGWILAIAVLPVYAAVGIGQWLRLVVLPPPVARIESEFERRWNEGTPAAALAYLGATLQQAFATLDGRRDRGEREGAGGDDDRGPSAEVVVVHQLALVLYESYVATGEHRRAAKLADRAYEFYRRDVGAVAVTTPFQALWIIRAAKSHRAARSMSVRARLKLAFPELSDTKVDVMIAVAFSAGGRAGLPPTSRHP